MRPVISSTFVKPNIFVISSAVVPPEPSVLSLFTKNGMEEEERGRGGEEESMRAEERRERRKGERKGGKERREGKGKEERRKGEKEEWKNGEGYKEYLYGHKQFDPKRDEREPQRDH
jgi:hypothetical protein